MPRRVRFGGACLCSEGMGQSLHMAEKNSYTVPGLTSEKGARVAEILQDRLNAYNDLHLTLKHIHWNVVGPNFISVHEMLDPQVEAVRGFADDVAERIATLGSSAKGTPAPSSPSAAGTTTRSVARRPSSTSEHSTWSTPESSRPLARTSRRSARSTPSPRTCSSARAHSSNSSTGSSARTWRIPVASCPPPTRPARSTRRSKQARHSHSSTDLADNRRDRCFFVGGRSVGRLRLVPAAAMGSTLLLHLGLEDVATSVEQFVPDGPLVFA